MADSDRAELGRLYPYRLTTHCGLARALVDFDGSFWIFDPAVTGDEEAPAGYEEPFDHGQITLLTADRASYSSSGGRIVMLARQPGTRDLVPCR